MVYGMINDTICIWPYHTHIRIWYVPYTYSIKYLCGTEHHHIKNNFKVKQLAITIILNIKK